MIADRKNRKESPKQTIPIVRKFVSFFDHILKDRLPHRGILAEGDAVSGVISWERLLKKNFEAILSEADTDTKGPLVR